MTLTALQTTPFDLEQGNLVRVKIEAVNNYGTSLISASNSGGALIETVPHMPTQAPQRGTNTGEAQIELIISPLTGTNTGGS